MGLLLREVAQIPAMPFVGAGDRCNLQASCKLEPAVPRPRLYAGADQPARLSLEIDAIKHRGETVPVVSQDVLQMPFCAITRLARSDGTHLPKVLVVAPLSSHFPILLRDLVLGLLPSFQVFMTDWVNARHVPVEQGPFDLDENTSYIVEAMRLLAPELNVIALCQAGVPALVATAYHANNDSGCAPRGLVLIAAPIDPAANPTRVSRLIRSRTLSWYERNVIAEVSSPDAGKGRLVYPGSVQLLGLWAYLARHLREGGELLGKMLTDDGADPVRFPFLDLYSAVMDLPAEVFIDILRHVYLERTLASGTLRARNQTVGLQSIRGTALMTVEGEHDDIAAPGQTQRAHDLCPSVPADARRQLVVPACGHFSLFHGDIWRTRVLPEVRAFIGQSNGPGSHTTC
jgi:poly(3-hydroxybutyrate) depolymerase